MPKQTILVVLLPLLLLSLVLGYEEQMPNYFTNPSPLPFRPINTQGGQINITYKDIYSSYKLIPPDIFEMNYSIQASNYAGYETYASGFPYIHVKFEIWGDEKWYIRFNGTIDKKIELDWRFKKHTIISLYHSGDNDKLIVYMTMDYAWSGPGSPLTYHAEIYFMRVVYNETTGDKQVVELSHVGAYGTTENGPPLSCEFVIIPTFWSKYVLSGTYSYLYMIYGYRGYVRFWSGNSAIDEGTFQFAWETKDLGPHTNVTQSQVAAFVNDLQGWYVWIGLGIRYFEPYNSLIETIPDNWTTSYTNRVDLGSDIIGGPYSSAELLSHTYTAYMRILDIHAENWQVDINKLYGLFVQGSLEAYKGAYFNIVDRTSNEYIRGLALGLVPIVFGIAIIGWSWKTKLAPLIAPIVVIAVGNMMGIYGIAETVTGLLGVAIIFIYRLWVR